MTSSVIVMFSLVPNASFGGTPSGQTYQAVLLGGTTYGVIYNVNPIDVTFLAGLGCQNVIPFNNPDSNRAPLATDDYTKGYGVGSLWSLINGSLSTLYVCNNMGATPDNASWISVTGPQGAQGPVGPQGSSGVTWEGVYNSGTNYTQGQGVAYSGSAYVSLVNANVGNTPSSSPTQWMLLGLLASVAPIINVFATGGQSNMQGQSGDPTLSPQVPTGFGFQYYSGAISSGNDPVGNANPMSMCPAFECEFILQTGERVLMVPSAVGGTNQSYQTSSSGTSTWDTPTNGGTLAPALVANVTAAMVAARAAGYAPVFRGILWSQGENDAEAIGNSATIPPSSGTTVTGGPYSAGTTSISVASGTGLVTGQSAIITLDNGATFTSLITVSGTSITLSTAVPAGRSIPNGAGFEIYTQSYYEAAFERMANYFRTVTIDSTTFPELPIFISQTGGPGSGDQLGYQKVRQAQDRICSNDPYTKIVFRGAVDFIARGLMQNPAASYTAPIAGTTMTVTAVGSGSVQPFGVLAGSGVSANTLVSAFGAGGTTGVGGKGTYQISPSQSVSSTTITQSGSNLHYLAEGYNEMGREMAKGVVGAQDDWLHQTYNVSRIPIGGSLTIGDLLTITLTSTAISGSPWLVTHTILAGDTFATFAAAMGANGTIFSPNLAAVGIFFEYEVTSWGAVISVYQPTALYPQAAVTAAWSGGGGTETVNVTAGGAAFGLSPDIYYNKGRVTVGGQGVAGSDFFNVLVPTSLLLTLGTNTFPAGIVNPVAAGSDNNLLRLGNNIASDIADQRVGLLFQPDINLYTEFGTLYGGAIIASHYTVTGRPHLRFGGYSGGTWLTFATLFGDGSLQVGTGTTPLGQGNAAVAGNLQVQSAGGIPAGGTTGAGIGLSTVADFGIFFGSGAPTLSAAQGSLYLRSDGSGTANRAYINTNGSTGWTALTTAS